MQAMFDTSLLPLLERRLGAQVPLAVEEVIVRLPEAEFSADLRSIAGRHPGVTIGSYPRAGSPLVTLRVRGPREAVAEAAAEIRRVFARAISDETPARG
jgi:molybdopterin-biosynthesis enzyme MoeA-like protein